MNHQSVSLRFLFLALCAFALLIGAQAQSGAKYALVMGNGNYDFLGKLKNPVNDATDISAALKSLGFSVDTITDAALDRMENAVVAFGNKLSGDKNAVGLFYYAGHGVQSGGVNYLIPTGVTIASESFLKQKALATQSILDTMQASGNALNVVILDA